MKRIIPNFLLFFLLGIQLMGQQEDQFTLFTENRIFLNPAFAGNREGEFVSASYRNQWLGFEGAPQTQLVNFNVALINDNLGLGGHVLHHTIGFNDRYSAALDYAYGIPLGNGKVRIGLRTSVRLVSTNFSDASGTQPVNTDNAIPEGLQSKYVPNFGGGIYYDGRDFYVGVSVPRFLENNLTFGDTDIVLSKEIKHIYGMGGFLISVGTDEQMLQTDFLLKYVEGAPFDADAQIRYYFNFNFMLGAGYRLGGSSDFGVGESASAHMGIGLGEKMLFMVSYDYSLSKLQSYNNGTIEAHVAFYFNGRRGENDQYVSPLPDGGGINLFDP